MWAPVFESRTTRFIVLARYRSGSNLLSEALNSHAGVLCLDELYNISALAGDLAKLEDPIAIARTAFEPSHDRGVSAVGFKLMYEQATDAELELATWGPDVTQHIRGAIRAVSAYLDANPSASMANLSGVWEFLQQDPALRVIHLRRRHQLEAFVSLQLALREDDWIGDAYSSRGVRLDSRHCEQWCARGRRLDERYSAMFASHPVLHIDYEALCQDFAGTLTSVFSFLGLSSQAVEPATRKQRTEGLDTLVENYKKLERTFQNTGSGTLALRADDRSPGRGGSTDA